MIPRTALGDELLADVDAHAAKHRMTRAAAIRQLLRSALVLDELGGDGDVTDEDIETLEWAARGGNPTIAAICRAALGLQSTAVTNDGRTLDQRAARAECAGIVLRQRALFR